MENGSTFQLVEIVVTLVGIAVAAGMTAYQLNRSISIRRARLKHDLEVLRLTKDLGIDMKELHNRVEGELKSFVSGEMELEERSLIHDPRFIGMTIYGLAVFFGFTVWTVYLVQDGFSWWAILTGLFAFGGIMQPFVAWNHAKENRTSSADTTPQTEMPDQFHSDR